MRHEDNYYTREEQANIRHEAALERIAAERDAVHERECASLHKIGRKLLRPEDMASTSGSRESAVASISWKPNRHGIGVEITHRQHGTLHLTVQSLDQV